MAIFKCTMMCQSGPECKGWSHSLYREEQTYQQAIQKLLQLGLSYLNTQGGNVQITHMRVSNEAIRGDARTANAVGMSGRATPEGGLPDRGVLVALETANGRSFSYLFKSIVDEWESIANKTSFALTADGQKAWGQFLDHITANDWRLRFVKQPTEADKSPIQSLTVDEATGVYTITTTTNTLVSGDEIFIGGRGVRKWKPIQGVRYVEVVDERTFTIKSDVDCNNTLYRGGLQWWRREHEYLAIATWAVKKLSTRIGGRPFGLPRGRSRPRLAVCT